MSEQRAGNTVTLTTIAHGAAVELFDAELARVLENVADPNTEPKQKRVITLKVTIKPNEDRDLGAVVVEVASKTAAMKPAGTIVYFGRIDKKHVAVERDPRQEDLFDKQQRPTVVPMPSKEREE